MCANFFPPFSLLEVRGYAACASTTNHLHKLNSGSDFLHIYIFYSGISFSIKTKGKSKTNEINTKLIPNISEKAYNENDIRKER
jgi:hypothetical protein